MAFKKLKKGAQPQNKNEAASQEQKKKYEQKDFTGALFENSKKVNDNQPDLQGSVVIEGVEYWVSAWEKISAKGQSYYSLAFKTKE